MGIRMYACTQTNEFVYLCSLCALLTSPDDRTLFMYSRKDSSLISLSVKMKLMPFPCWPAVRYKPFKSSIRLAVLYELPKNKTTYTQFFPLFLRLLNQTKLTNREKDHKENSVYIAIYEQCYLN